MNIQFSDEILLQLNADLGGNLRMASRNGRFSQLDNASGLIPVRRKQNGFVILLGIRPILVSYTMHHAIFTEFSAEI